MYKINRIILLTGKVLMTLLLGNVLLSCSKSNAEDFKIISRGNIKEMGYKNKENSNNKNSNNEDSNNENIKKESLKTQDENLVKIKENIGKLGYELMGEQIKENDSYFFSPLSLYVALSAFRPGTIDKSYEELSAKLVPEGMSEDDFDIGLRNIIFAIDDKKDFGLKNKTLVAIDSQKEFSDDYIEKSSGLGADLIAMDFLNNSKKSTKSLNEWVANETNDLINPLFAEPLPSETVLTLINTLYFKDEWVHHFGSYYFTKKDKFYKKDKKIEIDFMRQEAKFGYGENNKFQYISMKYKNGANMEVYLPKDNLEPKDIFAEVMNLQNYIQEEKNTEKSSIYTVKDESLNIEMHVVDLTFPKFTQEDEISLNELLNKSGISQIFKRDGTSGLEKFFKKIDEKVWVDQVFQKTKVIVDEEGTEAAAATGAVLRKEAIEEKPQPKVMIVNRPFIYQIKYEGILLFMGVYNGE